VARDIPNRVAAWVSDHPFRVAGGISAVAAAAVVWLSLDGGGGTAGGATQATGGVTLDAVLAYALAHPAYPLAVLVGVALLAYPRG
jgi:hypothetical protein